MFARHGSKVDAFGEKVTPPVLGSEGAPTLPCRWVVSSAVDGSRGGEVQACRRLLLVRFLQLLLLLLLVKIIVVREVLVLVFL